MEKETSLVKKTEIGVVEYNRREYLAELTRFTTDTRRIVLIEEAADQCIARFINNPDHAADICLISNEVGHALATQQLTVEAMLAYQFAFEEEEAYHPNRDIYARNFLAALNSHFQNLGSQIPAEEEELFFGLGSTVLEARDCVVSRKNQAVFENAYRNVQSGQEDLKSWPNPDLLKKALDNQQAEQIGSNLLTHLKHITLPNSGPSAG